MEQQLKVPESSLLKLLDDSLNNAKRLELMKERKETIAKGRVKLEVTTDQERLTVTRSVNRDKLSVSFPSSVLAVSTHTLRTIPKLLTFILYKWSRNPNQQSITFTMSELRSIGLYSKHTTVHESGIADMLAVLQTTTLSVNIIKKEQRIRFDKTIFTSFTADTQERRYTTFTLTGFTADVCTALCEYWMTLPTAYFGLSANASNLLWAIEYIRRQNRNTNRVTMLYVIDSLGLPEVKRETMSLAVIKPIRQAIQEVNELDAGYHLTVSGEGRFENGYITF